MHACWDVKGQTVARRTDPPRPSACAPPPAHSAGCTQRQAAQRPAAAGSTCAPSCRGGREGGAEERRAGCWSPLVHQHMAARTALVRTQTPHAQQRLPPHEKMTAQWVARYTAAGRPVTRTKAAKPSPASCSVRVLGLEPPAGAERARARGQTAQRLRPARHGGAALASAACVSGEVAWPGMHRSARQRQQQPPQP